MNENLDLTKILEGCPKGTEFYSPIFAELLLEDADCLKFYSCDLDNIFRFQKSGSLMYLIAKNTYIDTNGECLIFPSKDQRDWSKFERFWDKPKVEKFDPKTFQPFDKVLVRDDRKDIWGACLFSHPGNNLSEGWFVCDNRYWHYIIPYNDDTKHLVGTKDDCPEYYKWWEE